MKGWGYSLAVLVGALFGWLAQQFWLASQTDDSAAKAMQLVKSEQRIKRLSESNVFSEGASLSSAASEGDEVLSPELQLLRAGEYQGLLDAYQGNELVYGLTPPQLEILIKGLIELERFNEALFLLNDLLEQGAYNDEREHELYMANVVADIDDIFSQASQWQRLTDMYAWLVSVQPSHIPYVLRFVHWLIETKRYDQAESQLVSARNDVLYVGEVERLESALNERRNFELSDSQSIPLERVGNHFIVELEFESGERARMLIDTGASLSVIKESELNRLALSQLDQEPVTMKTANGLLDAQRLTAPSVNLGGRLFSNVDMVTTPLTDFAYDGLLGMSVLGRLKFYIDQEQSALVIGQY